MASISSHRHRRRGRPWQWDWKRPRWTTTSSSAVISSERDIITTNNGLKDASSSISNNSTSFLLKHSSSLQVTPSELPAHILQAVCLENREISSEILNSAFLCLEVHGWRQSQRNQSPLKEKSRGATHIEVQLTLIPMTSISDEPEEEKTPNSEGTPENNSTASSKTLLQAKWPWPASLLNHDDEPSLLEDENRDEEPAWKRFWLLDGLLRHSKQKNSKLRSRTEESILDAKLARKPPVSQQSQVTQAQETLALLSMLGGGEPGVTIEDEDEEHTDENNNDGAVIVYDESSEAHMQLFIVTNTGHVLIYDPWKLLQSSELQNDVEKEDDLSRGMAQLLFGAVGLYQTPFLPLSHYQHEFCLSIMKNHHSRQSAWNVYLEPSSLHLATRSNRPVSTCTTTDYLIVAGQGERIPLHDTDETKLVLEMGGFVTLVSLHYGSEATTCFLPFPPTNVAPLDMNMSANYNDDRNSKRSPGCVVWNKDKACWIRLHPRFRLVPIRINVDLVRILEISNTATPVLTVLETVLYDDIATTAVIVQHRLVVDHSGDSSCIIVTEPVPGHVARISLSSPSSLDDIWAYSGQGWSLLGTVNRTFTICWEGSTRLTGAGCVEELPFHGQASPCPIKHYMTNDANSSDRSDMKIPFTQSYRMPSDLRLVSGTEHMFKSSLSLPTTNNRRSVSQTNIGLVMDDVVVDALESISGLQYRENTPTPPSPSRRPRLTNLEKSQRFLRHCSSWNQLESKPENKDVLEQQIPILRLMFRIPEAGVVVHPHHVLSLRKIVLDNGATSPFQQVLAWLSSKKDLFTAASIALDLLRDPDTLLVLWKYAGEETEHDDEELHNQLEGLLDGILPIQSDGSERKLLSGSDSHQYEVTVQLADMTIGCFTKGGYGFSRPLNVFLRSNRDYDPSRASLMLAATSSQLLSEDSEYFKQTMRSFDKEESGTLSTTPTYFDSILWSVDALLNVGVSRDYLEVALLLLNSAVSDVLRNRYRNDSPSSRDFSLQLSLKLISMIVSSGEQAVSSLLNLVDDEKSRRRFWQSLDHGTRLEYSVLEIDNNYLLLRHTEVREWVREELHFCLKNEHAAGANNALEAIPSAWLQRLIIAVLANAGCNKEDLKSSRLSRPVGTASFYSDLEESKVSNHSNSNDSTFVSATWPSLLVDGLDEHKLEITETRRALSPSPGTGGIDFDLMIPSLLILALRSEPWHGTDYIETQSLLDNTCFLAGRYEHSDEPLFPFDGVTIMKQCALAGNVRAGANLVGGKNGFILICCEILISELDTTMEEAEAFLINEKLGACLMSANPQSASPKSSQFDSVPIFEIRDAHRRLLWLFDEHVLSVRTYGEFETTHCRGRVDPVFAARSIFRTWNSLNESSSSRKDSSAWLIGWLRQKLGILGGNVSSHRLACAAVARALLWSSSSDKQEAPTTARIGEILGHDMCIEPLFLIELCQGCCGLVESTPPWIAEEILLQSSKQESVEGAHWQA